MLGRQRNWQKANSPAVTAVDKGSRFALTRKGANLPLVYRSEKDCTFANVREPEMHTSTDLTDKELSAMWKTIDWKQAEKVVSNLQTRIARAALDKRWKDVRRLTRLLTRSHFAKLIAVRQVTTSKGSNTPGVDGTTWRKNAEKMRGVINLNNKEYRAMPLLRKFIRKKNGKLRPLSIPTMSDRAMQALYALALSPIEAATGDLSSFGFRKYRSPKDACTYLFICLSQRKSAQWVLEADIKSCFDMISHEWLLTNIPMNQSVLRQFLKAGFLEGERLYPSKSGTPQGGVISPILANMTLNGLETILGKRFYSNKSGVINKTYNHHKVNFVRYADDIVITADTPETAEEIKQILKTFLIERGLELSEEKTHITHIGEGFTFLGWEFRKFTEKVIVTPSKESVKNILDKVHAILRKGRSWSQDNIISAINPVIRGWCNYHNHVCASRTFSKMDHVIFQMIYSWVKRKHHNESKWATVKKYWHQKGSRKWVFSTPTKELVTLSKAKIIRHRMIQREKNPYLEKEYFENRRKRIKRNKSFI